MVAGEGPKMLNQFFKITFLSAAFVTMAVAQFVPAFNSPFAAGPSPVAVAVADFQGLSHLDIAVASQSGNSITMLYGDGTGNFPLPLTAPPPPRTPITFPQNTIIKALIAWDFNKDGVPDLAIAYTYASKGYVAIYFGDPQNRGSFIKPLTMPVGKTPNAIATGDFDGDGVADLAVTDIDGNTVTILTGKIAPDGTYSAPTQTSLTTGNKPSSITIADFDNNQTLDLAITNELDNTVSVFKGDGKGGFKADDPISTFQAGPGPGFVTSGDFNGDGNIDLAIANLTSNAVTLLLGNGTGGFSASPSSPISTGTTPVWIGVADFNGDYIPDLAIANQGSNTVTVLLGDGMGGFKPATNSPLSVDSSPRALGIGDFNEDGTQDLAVANLGASDVTILLNSYTTVPAMMSAASYMPVLAPSSIAIITGTGLAPMPPPIPPSTSMLLVTFTDASGTTATVSGTNVLFQSPTQINLLVPAALATGMASFTVTNPMTPILPQKGSVMIGSVAPGIFTASQTGKGVASGYFFPDILSSSGAMPIFSCPTLKTCAPVQIDVGKGNGALVLYTTGIRNRASLSSVTVTIAGQTLQPFYAGPAPDFTNEDQVIVPLPATLAHSGVAYITVTIGSSTSNQATIYLP